MKKDEINLKTEYEIYNEEPKFEFPKEIFSLSKESEDLLNENKNIKIPKKLSFTKKKLSPGNFSMKKYSPSHIVLETS